MTTPNTNGEAKQVPLRKLRWEVCDVPDTLSIVAEDEIMSVALVPCEIRVLDDGVVECDPEAVAYADLFTAAPQMFEALEDALNFLRGSCANQLAYSDTCIDEKIENALALARGEEARHADTRGESDAEGSE